MTAELGQSHSQFCVNAQSHSYFVCLSLQTRQHQFSVLHVCLKSSEPQWQTPLSSSDELELDLERKPQEEFVWFGTHVMSDVSHM